ncbi:unnamed protein product [Ranitomeya imitator]|uniref:Glycerol-3-phosphate dehydrogenase n=1 Tax=Ranitomeya imitator TaxID=111125 RepID=A0ABN9MEP4_9NEOB|nr:unnamed protein product [Ranitomeya imitator]
MAFRNIIQGTLVLGGGAVATVFGLSHLTDKKRKANFKHVQAAELVRATTQNELPSREAQLLTLESTKEFDVLVVGGGATGCGCALDAVTRGLKTALVERDDFSSGTSSRSTKLIHGGVRYLQKAIMKLDVEQYKLVKEALHERANLLEIAPHLSAPLPIMLPVYKWWQLPYYWVGIKAYDLVAGSQCLKSSYVLSKSKALELFPMLQKDRLVGAIVYYDGLQRIGILIIEWNYTYQLEFPSVPVLQWSLLVSAGVKCSPSETDSLMRWTWRGADAVEQVKDSKKKDLLFFQNNVLFAAHRQ